MGHQFSPGSIVNGKATLENGFGRSPNVESSNSTPERENVSMQKLEHGCLQL